MKDRTVWALLFVAALLAALYVLLLWCMIIAPWAAAKPLTVQWVKLSPPSHGSYESWLPCVRTSGWAVPVATCYPGETRSVLLPDDEEDPEPGGSPSTARHG